MTPAPKSRPPKLSREEIARFSVADLADELLLLASYTKQLQQKAERALECLNTARREEK
jgi:hypothetical protein